MTYSLHQVPNHASRTFAFRHPPARTAAAAGCSSSNVIIKAQGCSARIGLLLRLCHTLSPGALDQCTFGPQSLLFGARARTRPDALGPSARPTRRSAQLSRRTCKAHTRFRPTPVRVDCVRAGRAQVDLARHSRQQQQVSTVVGRFQCSGLRTHTSTF